MKRDRLHDGDTFEHRGYTFKVRYKDDDTYRPEPWNEYDGHGIISDWRPRDSKGPGERILCSYRGSCLFYDVAGTTRKARKEQWGCSSHQHATKGEAIACAVDQDFDRWRRYCAGDWTYVGVVVTLTTDTDETESLWGIESDSDELTETAYELADGILARIEVDSPDIQVSEN